MSKNTCGTCGCCRDTHDGPYCFKGPRPRPVSTIREMDCWVDPSEVQQPQATKVCSHCGRELPVENFWRHSRTKDGYQPCCKECQSEMNKGHRKRQPFQHNEAPARPLEPEKIPDGMKKCSHCGRLLPIAQFNKHGRAKDGLQAACKECQVTMTTEAKKKRKAKDKELREKARAERLLEAEKKAATADFCPVSDPMKDITLRQLLTTLKEAGFQGTITFEF